MKRKIKYLNVAEGSEWSKTKAFWASYDSAYNCAKELVFVLERDLPLSAGTFA